MCEFQDASLCGFTQDDNTDFGDWTWQFGPTSTPNTGPSNDASYGTPYGKSYTAIFLQQKNGNSSILNSMNIVIGLLS